MNKGFKVLSSVLAMSMVLASGVFALDWSTAEQEILKDRLSSGNPTDVETVKVSSVYEKLVNAKFKKDLEKYAEANKNLAEDVKLVTALGTARCEAQFDLDSANNQIVAARKFVELAKGVTSVKAPDNGTELKTLTKDEKVGKINYAELFGKPLLKEDAEKLAALKKANLDLAGSLDKAINDAKDAAKKQAEGDKEFEKKVVEAYKAAHNQEDPTGKPDKMKLAKEEFLAPVLAAVTEDIVAPTWLDSDSEKPFESFGLNLGTKKNKALLKANTEALNELNKKVLGEKSTYNESVYAGVVTKLSQNYGSDGSKSAEQVASTTNGKLFGEAQKAAGKIHLIERFAKEHGITLCECNLADFTAKASAKAAKAENKNKAKKDDVPNTASYFTIYVPTCEFAAPAVKYYGAAQVYEKALRRPLVCKNVKKEIVKVPMFTFDELTAYDVACCCCK